MHWHKLFERKIASLIVIGGLLLGLMIGVSRYVSAPEKRTLLPETDSAKIEAARREGYAQGYQDGSDAAYKKGYETARKEIGSGAFTTYGITGFVLGLLASIGGFVALNKKALAERLNAWRKKYELKQAFQAIPPNLSPEVTATAEQIARAYTHVAEQFRSAGYPVARYVEQWRPTLKALMGKAVKLLELIQELETARTNVDAQKLTRTMTDLRSAARHAKDDETRNAAIKSLKQAKQTQTDLQKTNSNLEQCKTALKGMTGVLESMHLKISNLKVNAQKTELLDELSSDLETEMAALEETLQEFTA